VAVLMVCYFALDILPTSIVVYVLVVAYVGASIFAEIAPDRFLRGTPGDFAETISADPPTAWRNKRRR
jgi:hypothetical protein